MRSQSPFHLGGPWDNVRKHCTCVPFLTSRRGLFHLPDDSRSLTVSSRSRGNWLRSLMVSSLSLLMTYRISRTFALLFMSVVADMDVLTGEMILCSVLLMSFAITHCYHETLPYIFVFLFLSRTNFLVTRPFGYSTCDLRFPTFIDGKWILSQGPVSVLAQHPLSREHLARSCGSGRPEQHQQKNLSYIST